MNRRELLAGATVLTASLAMPSVLRAQETIKIGLQVPSSGPLGFIGNDFINASKLAAYQYNGSGGILGKQVEFIIRDDKFSGAEAITAARELAAMGVNLQLGGVVSGPTLAVIPILEELKTVWVGLSSVTTSITHENFVRNMFRPAVNNYMLGRGLATSVLQNYKDVAKWRVVASDNAFGHDSAKTFAVALKEAAAKGGLPAPTVLDPLIVSASQADFRNQINELMTQGVDGVFLTLPGAPSITYHRQAIEAGYDQQYKVVLDVNADSIAAQLGEDVPANLWTYSYWPYRAEPLKSQPESQKLLEDFKSLTGGGLPNTNSMVGFRSIKYLLEGIKLAKATDTDSVIAALENVQFEVMGEKLSMRKEDHQGLGPIYFSRVVKSDTNGWANEDVVMLRGEDLAEPPSPGKPFQL